MTPGYCATLNDPCLSPHSKCEADRPVASLPSFSNARSLEYANFILQARNAANEVTDGCGSASE